ncbi:MAG: archaellin/type IV pilin N-terminal domain-containing protein [Candidatus Bathyarchaeia archaeon]
MKTLRRIRKNAKALSPVVASIILIAVTVAVSIAVAAWMGALSVGFMSTEQLTITTVAFDDTSGTNNLIVLNVRNTGTTAVNITAAVVNNLAETITDGTQFANGGVMINANSPGDLTITLASGHEWASGATYAIKVTSLKGTAFSYTAVAP